MLATLIVLLLVTGANSARSQETIDAQPGDVTRSQAPDRVVSIDIAGPLRGFLFVDGRYIHAVRQLGLRDGKLIVNGAATTVPIERLEMMGRFYADDESDDDDDLDADFDSSRMGEPNRWEDPPRVIAALLRQGESVALWTNDRPVVLLRTDAARDLLETLIDVERRAEVGTSPPTWLPSRIDHERWIDWIVNFEPSDAFLKRAEEELAFLRSREASNRFDIAASHRLDDWIGSLTTILVLIVVVASGQVLLHPPQQETRFFDVDQTSAAWWIQVRTTLLIAGFAACDGLMMALAYQAGRLREFNPLTSKLLADPTPVVLTRVVLAFLCVIPLLLFWKYAGVRKTAWWICLTLTVFAVRELAMLSMAL